MNDIALVLPTLGAGGAEKVNLSYVDEFISQGYSVDLVVFRARGELLEDVNKSANVVDLGAARLKDGFIPLCRYLRKNKPEKVFANMWPITFLVVIANLISFSSSKVCVVEHTTLSRSNVMSSISKRMLARLLISFSYRIANCIVTVSSGIADDLVEFACIPRSKVHVVPNAYKKKLPSLKDIEHARSAWPLSNEYKRIVAIGSLKEVKNLDYLLDALRIAAKKIKVALVLVGDGDQRENLEKKAKQLEHDYPITFAGYAKYPESYLVNADLLVLSSKVEGLPMVILEALAFEIPVVSTDCPSGPNEILGGGRYGRLAPLDNKSVFADQIVNELLSPTEQALLASRAKDYLPTSICTRLLQIND